MNVALLVVAIVVFNGLIQLTVWTLIFRRFRRISAELPGELSVAGERLLCGPERVSYSGATEGFSPVHGFGVLALTDRRVVFRRLGGKTIEIPLADVVGLKNVTRWTRTRGGSTRTSSRSGRGYFVLVTRSAIEVGFAIKTSSHPLWHDAFSKAGIADLEN